MTNYTILLLVLLTGASCIDAKYQNTKQLNKMANALNEALPLESSLADECYIENDHPKNFFIYDLIDTTNNDCFSEVPIKLKKEGIYHFSPYNYMFSYSHIAVIHNGKMKIFSFLNCENKGNTIQDVLLYAEKHLKYDKVILRRIKNYRINGCYYKRDPQSKLECPPN